MNKLVTSQTRYVLYGVLLVALVASLIILFKILAIPTYFDFNYYYLALHEYTVGNNPYLIRYFSFPYPPLAILILLPFTLMPLSVAAKCFVVISFICVFSTLFILFRLFKIPYFSVQSAIIIILTCNYFPVKWTLAGGQINALVLLFVVLFINWFVEKRDIRAGVVLGIAVMLKLFPPFLIPYLFFIKKFSILKSFFFSLLLFSIFVLILIPLPVIVSYFNATLPTFLHTGGGTYYFDQSISAFMARSISSSFAKELSKPLALILLLFTFVILWKYRHNDKIELLSISVLIILNIILGNFAWQHHFIWLIVPYIITFIYIKNNLLSKKYYFILAISYLLTAANIPNPRLVPSILQSHVFYGAAVFYFLLLYFIITQPNTIQLQKTTSRVKNKLISKSKSK